MAFAEENRFQLKIAPLVQWSKQGTAQRKTLSLFIPTSAGIIFMYTLRTVCLQSRVNVLQILA